MRRKLNLTILFALCYFSEYPRTSGAVAQLGERLNGIQEADGSIPFSSTKDNKGLGRGRLLDPFFFTITPPQPSEILKSVDEPPSPLGGCVAI